MASEQKQRKLRLTDEDWDEHCEVARRANVSANALIEIYVRRGNAVANGRQIVEDNDLPAHVKALPGGPVGKAFTPNAPGLDTSMVPFAGGLERRGPAPKGGKK